MKIERTKNAARNIAFDGMLKLLNIIIPFFLRSIMLNYLGVEYLGLSGLFRSILSFLNLAELGVGSAMVFSMYKPIAEDDTPSICALLKLYRTFYRAIGLFIAVVGLALTPFLRSLINGDIPSDMNLYILYFMNLGSTVLTYWLFAYKRSLLDAHQRTDVISKVSLITQFVEYALKLPALIIFKNYYMFLGVQLGAQVVINLLTAMQVNKMYPQYSPQGRLPRKKVIDIVHRVRDLFTSKFAGVVFNFADTIVISAFMGLATLAVYQNYFFIITALRTFIDVIIVACIAGVGNSLVTESEEKNYKDFSRITMLFGWIMGVGSAMLLCLYQPFMQDLDGERKHALLPLRDLLCDLFLHHGHEQDRQHVQGRRRHLAQGSAAPADSCPGQPGVESGYGTVAGHLRGAAVLCGCDCGGGNPLAVPQPFPRGVSPQIPVALRVLLLRLGGRGAGRLRGVLAFVLLAAAEHLGFPLCQRLRQFHGA